MKQKFKLLTAFLCGAVFFSGVSYASTGELVAKVVDFKIVVNGKETTLNNDPVLINNYTYLPVRDVAELLKMDVGFEKGVITLDESKTLEDESKNIDGKGVELGLHVFNELPITQTKNDVSITVESVDFTDISTDFNITVVNNSEESIYADFTNVMGFNYMVEGKKYKTTGTLDQGVFKEFIPSGNTVSGVLRKGGIDEGSDNLILHVSINNRRDFTFSFPILLK